jgi:ubiquinone/menaquinone biosynthesis C-methylase UbiE
MMTNFSEIAARYEKNALVQRSAADQLFDLIGIKETEDVLDLGCGTGHLAKRIRETTRGKVVAVDASEGMIREADQKYSDANICFEVCPADRLPYKDSFDVIFCNSTFQWFKDPMPVLKSCHGALRHKGIMGIQAPARKVYSPNFIEALEHVRTDPRLKALTESFEIPWFFLDSAEEYKILFEHTGFEVIYATIERVESSHTPEAVFAIFDSGAAAGYLNDEFYRTPLSEAHIAAFREVAKEAFIAQAGSDGQVAMVFFRIYLLARKL